MEGGIGKLESSWAMNKKGIQKPSNGALVFAERRNRRTSIVKQMAIHSIWRKVRWVGQERESTQIIDRMETNFKKKTPILL